MLIKQKAIEGECRITTVLLITAMNCFMIELILKRLAHNGKRVHGRRFDGTLDAIGFTIEKIGNVQKHTAEDYRAEKVLFVIITDGQENSSREYSVEKIKALIERQKERFGWEFIFLGANMDAVQTAGNFGISSDRALDYLADSEGTTLNFKVMESTITTFREKGTVDDACFSAIREDVKKRGKRR